MEEGPRERERERQREKRRERERDEGVRGEEECVQRHLREINNAPPGSLAPLSLLRIAPGS